MSLGPVAGVARAADYMYEVRVPYLTLSNGETMAGTGKLAFVAPTFYTQVNLQYVLQIQVAFKEAKILYLTEWAKYGGYLSISNGKEEGGHCSHRRGSFPIDKELPLPSLTTKTW